MTEYLELCIQVPSTIQKRKAILDKKREGLLEHIEELRIAVSYIDEK